MRFFLLLLSLPLIAQMTGKFYAAGATFQTVSHPELTGWASIALPLDEKRENWSFSAYSVIPAKSTSGYTLQTSTSTGLATQLKSFGPLHIFALGMGGFVTDGKNSGGSGSVGPLGVFPISKWKINILGAYLKTKTNLPVKDTDSYWLGIGKTF